MGVFSKLSDNHVGFLFQSFFCWVCFKPPPLSTDPHLSIFLLPWWFNWLSVRPWLPALRSPSPPLMLTSHIHYRVALARPALFPSVVLNYAVFLGQALVSSHCNDFLIICLYVMNEMEMYHHGQTGLAWCQSATPPSEWMRTER